MADIPLNARLPNAPELRWNAPEDTVEAAAFAARVISLSSDYISHGEIQTGLSPDGKRWADDLAALYAEDFAEPGDRDRLVVRNADDAVIAVAIVAWEETPRRAFAVLEDMAVDPDVRSSGLGALIINAVVARVAARKVEWLFLESGLRNDRAHAFFERHGFAPISHVFARRIAG